MSVESEMAREIRQINARLERLEALYPRVYQTMIRATQIGDTNIETGNEIIKLMDSVKKTQEKFLEWLGKENQKTLDGISRKVGD